MKKISFALLAILAILLVGCKGPNEQPKKTSYTLKFEINGTETVVKDGDVIDVSNIAKTFSLPDGEARGELGLDGHIYTDTEMILVVDLNRKVTAGSIDALCIGRCVPGQDIEGNDIPQLTYTLSQADHYYEISTHFIAGSAGENKITYTLYPQDQPDNKISFTANYIKQ